MAALNVEEVQEAINRVALAAMAASSGMLALCRELREAGVLPPESIDRIRATVLHEIDAGGPTMGVLLANSVRRLYEKGFADITPPAP